MSESLARRPDSVSSGHGNGYAGYAEARQISGQCYGGLPSELNFKRLNLSWSLPSSGQRR